MKKYRIITPSNTVYEIDNDGCFLRYDNHEWSHPHKTWKCTGCAELLPFGHLKLHSLNDFLEMIESNRDFRFKNGRPKYTLTDNDHGTFRVHGNTAYHGIYSAHVITTG
jgi:hypothetical protein